MERSNLTRHYLVGLLLLPNHSGGSATHLVISCIKIDIFAGDIRNQDGNRESEVMGKEIRTGNREGG